MRLFFLLSITCVWFFVLTQSAFAVSAVSEGTLDSLRHELDRIDKEIARGADREQDLLQQMDGLQRRISILEQVVREQRQKESSLNDSITTLTSELHLQETTLGELGLEIISTEDEEQKLSGAVARSMLARHRLSGWAMLEFLIGAHSWPELLTRRSMVTRLEMIGRHSLRALQTAEEHLKIKEDAVFKQTEWLRSQHAILQAKQESMLSLKRSIQGDLNELTANRKQLKDQIQRARKDRHLLAAQRDDILTAQREIEDLIQRMARGEPLSGVSLGVLKGSLPWPVAGRLVQKFGMVRNRELATLTENPGIDLETEAGSEVTAVAEGKVSSVSWLRGYGNVCIVEHPGAFYTVYAKLGQILVQPGQDIGMAHVIGYPGFDTTTGTYHVHFELWSGKTKKDPVPWLKPR